MAFFLTPRSLLFILTTLTTIMLSPLTVAQDCRLNTPMFLASEREVKISKTENFPVELEKMLLTGQNMISLKAYKEMKFITHSPFGPLHSATLPRQEVTKENQKFMVISGKIAAIIPSRSPDSFTLDQIKAGSFTKAILKKTVLKMNLDKKFHYKKELKKGPINLGSLDMDIAAEFINRPNSLLNPSQDVIKLLATFEAPLEKQVGHPVRVIVLRTKDRPTSMAATSKNQQSGLMVNKMYAIGKDKNNTLLVTYYYIVLPKGNLKHIPFLEFFIEKLGQRKLAEKLKKFLSSR